MANKSYTVMVINTAVKKWKINNDVEYMFSIYRLHVTYKEVRKSASLIRPTHYTLYTFFLNTAELITVPNYSILNTAELITVLHYSILNTAESITVPHCSSL